MTTELSHHHKLASKSGYVLQMALAAGIRGGSAPGWDLFDVERPWEIHPAGPSGYIDIIAQRGALFPIIEVKRRSEGAWYFFVDNVPALPSRRFKIYLASTRPTYQHLQGWTDFPVSPAMVQSPFCHVHGQGENRSTL